MSRTEFHRKRRVLVVEDQAELRDLLVAHFNEAGFSTATSDNGDDAVKKARTFLPDLILLDVLLPELDGFAVCEILRRHATTACIPVIMVTGLSSQFSRCAGIESGATDFVTKPVNPSLLVSKAEQMLLGRNPSTAPRKAVEH